jgi:hypothetical protein
MIIRPIVLDDLLAFAKTINGNVFYTLGRKKKFKFSLDEKGFHYFIYSTGKSRIQEISYVARCIEIYNKTGSVSPSAYSDDTINSSYISTIFYYFTHPVDN